MRALRHPNVATFFTAVALKNELFMISEYQNMGTLEVTLVSYEVKPYVMTIFTQEVSSNETFVFTPRKVYSLINSLVDGMIYLHESFLSFHGDLKSSNCLVNSNWKLKISGFGIQSLRQLSSTHRGK